MRVGSTVSPRSTCTPNALASRTASALVLAFNVRDRWTPFEAKASARPSQVFTVTQGGLGSVGPSAVELAGDRLTFTFDPPVCPGTTSFFFGLTSAHAPRDVIADVRDAAGNTYSLAAKAPAFP
jgi:hypothetical protein